MSPIIVDLDGDTADEKKLWQTYMSWSKFRAVGRDTAAFVDDPEKRLTDELSESIQVMLFCAILLEARLRRLMTKHNRKAPQGLKKLMKAIETLWREGAREEDLWENHESQLKSLARFRNAVVHGQFDAVLTSLKAEEMSPGEMAYSHYENVIRVIELLNRKFRYTARGEEESHRYVQPLLRQTLISSD